MATVSDNKTLICPLCFKKFTIPRMLPCSHSFCESCLQTHIESQIKGDKKFKCPLCTASAVLSDPKIRVEKWASTFPLNNVVISVMGTGVDKAQNNCEPCEIKGDTTNAVMWCTECPEKLCHSCERSHKRNKQSKDHKIVPITKMDQPLQSNINFDLKCGRHSNNLIKLFCVDHMQLCCAVCVATDHRQCNDVRSIDDIARDQSQRSTSDYPRAIRDFRKLKKKMKKIASEKKTNATQFLQEKNQILQDVNNGIDRIIARLNEFRNDFINKADQLYKDTESSMQENENMVQRFIANIENSSEILEAVDNIGTLQQKFAVFDHLRAQMASHYLQLKYQLKNDVEVHFMMKKNNVLSDMEKTLNSVGSVMVSSTPSITSRDALPGIDKTMKKLDSRTKINKETPAAQVENVEDLMASQTATFVKSVTRHELGKKTWFTGGTFLSDGRLVMTDYNNDRLVELNDEYNIVKEHKISSYPTDVATGNEDNEIYIAVNHNDIYKCTLHSDLTVVSKMEAPPLTWGIAVNGENIIVSTRDAVVILKQDGSTVRSIPKAGAYSFVVVSPTQRTIFHKDDDNVVCRTWEGQEVFRYRHPQLKVPTGMYIDKQNNVYICGLNSHNVHQVSPDGQKSRIILDKLQNISWPFSLVLHPETNEFLVTSNGVHTVCEIYRLG